MICDLCKHEPVDLEAHSKLCTNCAEGVRRLCRITYDNRSNLEMLQEIEWERARAAHFGR